MNDREANLRVRTGEVGQRKRANDRFDQLTFLGRTQSTRHQTRNFRNRCSSGVRSDSDWYQRFSVDPSNDLARGVLGPRHANDDVRKAYNSQLWKLTNVNPWARP